MSLFRVPMSVQDEISQLKASLSSRSEEVQKLQSQLAASQQETREMKGKYAELATASEDVQRRLSKEVLHSLYKNFLEKQRVPFWSIW